MNCLGETIRQSFLATYKGLKPLAPLALIALITSPTASAQAVGPAEFDCVIKPREIVDLGSAAEGVIRERYVERGDIVEAGQVVARLDDTMESIALDLARLEAERDIELRSRIEAAAFRTSEASRIENLATRKLTPQIEKERADMEQKLAAFGVRAAEMDQKVARIRLRMAQAALDRRTIRSSVSGVVIETSAAPGEYVNEQSTILTIVQLDVLNVEVFLPTAQFGLTTEGEIATVMPEAPIGGEYPATVETIDRMYDAASGTFGVRLKIRNDDYQLPAGLRCRVIFPGRRVQE